MAALEAVGGGDLFRARLANVRCRLDCQAHAGDAANVGMVRVTDCGFLCDPLQSVAAPCEHRLLIDIEALRNDVEG